MQRPSEYADALKCIRNRRYTPAASFMVEAMTRKAIHRISKEQMFNMTTSVARKLRQAHSRLLAAQSGGVPLQAMAEQAYRDVEGEMTAAGGGKASMPAAA